MKPAEEWWDEDDLALVEDRSRHWQQRTFQPSAAVRYPAEDGWVDIRELKEGERPPSGATIIESGWDHEHCKLCFSTISVQPQHDRVGFFDGMDWLCRACYTQYIVPRLNE